jgi:DNA invertase Pin-like site-specific DNA recombinase
MRTGNSTISGRKESRPAIDQLKRDVRHYRVPKVLFYRVNRIGRNVRASYATADEVESCGAEVVVPPRPSTA